MNISLSEILNLNGEGRVFTTDYEPEAFECFSNSYPVVKKTPITLKLAKVSDMKVSLEAHIDLTLSAPCDRCLEPVLLPFSFDIRRSLELNEQGSAKTEDDEETVSYIDAYELFVDRMVDEELMIGFPMKVLCSEECKGICTVCGANLNRGECGCDRTVLDPRMSIIRDLFQ